jgi:membrane protein YqaA with SNARE-associated domain
VKRLLALYNKYSALLLKLLAPLGFWGIGALSFLDSSSIPVPMDAFIAFYAWHDARHFYLYVFMAALGSAIGGLVPYFVGRAGGEIFLLKRINRDKYEALRDKFERQEFLALLIPSMMPPPTPWKLFVFGAGVFEMRVVNFMLAVFTGRLIRFGVESLLVIRYGPEIVHELTIVMHRHLVAVVVMLAVVFGAIAIYAIRKSMGKRSVASS